MKRHVDEDQVKKLEARIVQLEQRLQVVLNILIEESYGEDFEEHPTLPIEGLEEDLGKLN